MAWMKISTTTCCIPTLIFALIFAYLTFYLHNRVTELEQSANENIDKIEKVAFEAERLVNEFDPDRIYEDVRSGIDDGLDQELSRWRNQCPDPSNLRLFQYDFNNEGKYVDTDHR